MKKIEKGRFGCVKSELDGSEHVFKGTAKMEMPAKYSYVKGMSKVIDQGSEPICVPCSCSAVVNWRINIKDGKTDDHKVDLKQIYASRGDKLDGMMIKTALHFLRHEGVRTDRGVMKIGEYAMVKSDMALRQALVMNGPCIAGMMVRDSSRTDFWKGSGMEGGHAVVIVGYNTKGFLLRNSWGKGFGDEGYTVVPYEDFGSFMEIWTVI